MRIVAGRFKGMKLAPIPAVDRSLRLRPTPVRVRQSIFDMLTHGPDGDLVSGSRVLDLFAGSGAMGLEALSRQAAAALFVDNSKAACALIEANLVRTGLTPPVLRLDATALPPCGTAPFDLVFLDPPHGRNLAAKAARAAFSGGWLAAGAVLVIEDSSPAPAISSFAYMAGRRIGDIHVSIARLGRQSAV